MRFSYMSFTNTQRKILKVIYSPNFCSLHIVHCNCDCEVFFISRLFAIIVSIAGAGATTMTGCCWFGCCLLFERDSKGPSFSLIGLCTLVQCTHRQTTQHVQIHHNVVLEVDSRFMD